MATRKIDATLVDEAKPTSPNVGYERPELSEFFEKWGIVEDCLGGQKKVKSRGDAYLPRPNADDTSAANKTRYTGYLHRAVFYNVTRRTLDGLIGQVFSRDPLVHIPDQLKPLIDNVDGNGVTLDQQAKKALASVLAYGRIGLLVDYPVVNGVVTLAQIKSGEIRPTIQQYGHRSIINWRFIRRGALTIPSLVVLSENVGVTDDGFEVTNKNQWRVLQLIANVYTVTTWEQSEDTEYYVKTGHFVPTDSKGNSFDTIPFYIAGCMNNDFNIDEPLMYDLAVLNLAHFRNSADYEDSCYMVGQPTPYFAGLTQKWVDDVFKGEIRLGSRGAIPLPIGGTAGLLQVQENSMTFEAMKHKEVQMVALGAKLVENKSATQTLGEAQIDEGSESSILSTAAKNISAVYTLALKTCAMMMGAPEVEKTPTEYSLNTDFPGSRLTPNERMQLVAEWTGGAITIDEMRAGMRKAGVAFWDMEEYKKRLAADPPPAPEPSAAEGGAANDPKKKQDPENNGGNQNGV